MNAPGREDRSQVLHNTRIKSYPDGSQQVLCCDVPIFHGEGWEPEKKNKRRSSASRKKDQQETPEERAMRRARGKVRDLALCTPFRYFVTLTLDGKLVDRYDMTAITRKLNHWLDNQVRRKGLSYVLVPERHKDGAVHFHGFFNDALEVVNSGTITMKGFKKPRKPRSAAERTRWLQDGGQVVYNLPGWTLGFTTAIELYGEYSKAVSYVCKYIGKGGEKIGGRWYYSGGKLGQPKVDYTDSEIRDLEKAPGAYRFDLRAARMSFVMLYSKPDLQYNCSGSADVREKGGVVVHGNVPNSVKNE